MLKTTRYYRAFEKRIKENSINILVPDYTVISKCAQTQPGTVGACVEVVVHVLNPVLSPIRRWPD